MKVEKQGEMECVLATIAALSDVPLASVRDVALTTLRMRMPHARRWADLWSLSMPGRLGAETVIEVARFFGGAAVLAHVRHDDWRWLLGEGGTSDSVTTLSVRRRALPATGRGTIRIRYHKRLGHILPWSNGLAYDPEAVDPNFGETLAQLRARMRGWRVVRITFEKGASA